MEVHYRFSQEAHPLILEGAKIGLKKAHSTNLEIMKKMNLHPDFVFYRCDFDPHRQKVASVKTGLFHENIWGYDLPFTTLDSTERLTGILAHENAHLIYRIRHPRTNNLFHYFNKRLDEHNEFFNKYERIRNPKVILYAISSRALDFIYNTEEKLVDKIVEEFGYLEQLKQWDDFHPELPPRLDA